MLFGVIADDITGATDIALMLLKGGMRTTQVIGVPEPGAMPEDADAVVVALKSRTAPRDQAVAQSLRAAERLREAGARQLFFKYCSTFDSTDDGNIGPVADALLEMTGSEMTVVCPAFPATGRTIYRGHLFVGDVLLSDSGMKDHPLTPMTDANLVNVMARQSRHEVGLVPLSVIMQGPDAVKARLREIADAGMRYAVTDAVEDAHLETISAACADFKLLTGGSGLALGVPGNFIRQGLLEPAPYPEAPRVEGRTAVIAGSCSTATLAQLAHVRDRLNWPARRVVPLADRDVGVAVDEAVTWATDQDRDVPPVIYASADPAEVRAAQDRIGREAAGALVEDILSGTAQGLAERGFSRLIVAGGETSGAVMQALGVAALDIGPEIDPGVPWTVAHGTTPLALALKSGNFGAEDFFHKAWKMLP